MKRAKPKEGYSHHAAGYWAELLAGHAQSVQEKIAKLYRDGKSINQIRKELGVSYGTAWNYVQRLKG